jgi:vanillate O-demethylase monooxygenase subunit
MTVDLDALYPKDCSFTPETWRVFAGYWHPVATSDEVAADRPLGVTLLDVNVVLYRVGGEIIAALDRCPHRGTRLSLGAMRGERLVCPYHGLEFDGGGACVRVPGSPDAGLSLDHLSIPTFSLAEAYGLVWVCLSGAPAAPLPDWSCLEQEGNQRAVMRATWNCAAMRHLENFCDLAHFAYVHTGTFGSANHPVIEPYTVERRPNGLFFEVVIPMLESAVFDGDARICDVPSTYEVTMPFATRLSMRYPHGFEHICDAASPISAGRSRIFLLKSRDHDQHQPLEEWVRFQKAINEEDRIMVESQSPAMIPLARGAEKHLGSDRFSVAYRRLWEAAGLS